MAIVQTIITPDNHLQKDGKRYVTVRYIDHAGGEIMFVRKLDANADYQALAAARVPDIEAQLADAEFRQAIETDGWKPLVHQTGVQFAARFRALYKDSSKSECAKLATWILARITAGDFTDAQVRNAFGLTAGQWTTLKAKMTTLRDHYAAVEVAAGE